MLQKFFQQKIQIKMVEISNQKNLPQHMNSILQQKIELALQKAREFTKSKNSSTHSLSHKTIPTNCLIQNKHLTADAKPSRRVCFRPIHIYKQYKDKKKLKFILNDSSKRLSLKKPFKKYGVSINTIKSLDSSFAWISNEVEQNGNGVSLRLSNPQSNECKSIIDEILKKFQLFEDSNFLEKQLTLWIDSYAQKQKLILSKVFLRRLQNNNNSKKSTEIRVQRDREILYGKVSLRQKDCYKNVQRFVKPAELSQFDKYLENLYVQKTRIKMKEIEQDLQEKMTFVCKQVREQQNSGYHCSLRKKPGDIANFMVELKAFQSQFGELKRVSRINRNRFKLINETDLEVEMHAFTLNELVIEPAKNKQMETFYN